MMSQLRTMSSLDDAERERDRETETQRDRERETVRDGEGNGGRTRERRSNLRSYAQNPNTVFCFAIAHA